MLYPKTTKLLCTDEFSTEIDNMSASLKMYKKLINFPDGRKWANFVHDILSSKIVFSTRNLRENFIF